ncbi:MAG TPA: SWIM zinc finger family protein [Ilumatobacteraceae bacterium]|nr:SWIM zinc finger family protein [Ilumatobacteraceae bacterium]
MSPPRRPFGAEQPGRLQATMLKVLAAEMSDPGRLARGKRLRAEDAVVDLVVGHGAATAVVQGSRPDPYVVTLLTRAGRSVPSRRDVTVRCTCPDDDAVGSDACKHAVAALFALADEVSLDTDVLARWRQSDTFATDDDNDADDDNEDRSAIRPAPRRREQPAEPPTVDPLVAELNGLLGPPDGQRLPTVPDLAALDPASGIPDRLVADVLDDALAHLRVRWD